MSIYDRINRISGEPGTYDEKMYRILSDERYSSGAYKRSKLGEGMDVIYQLIWSWWKPRFLMNHNLKTAYEWMWPNQQLAIVDAEHIDWDSMKNLPEDAIVTLRNYSFQFPSFIRYFHNGIAEVKWQLLPDGRYWMDDDGYGMTGDIELNIYGFIDQEANIISKFHYYTDRELETNVLGRVREALESKMASRQPPSGIAP